MEALREENDTRDLPVIMLTSTPPLQGEQIAMDFGVAHYLTKPWTIDMVETVVQEAKVAKGEGDDFSGYLKPEEKKKPKALPKTHPD